MLDGQRDSEVIETTLWQLVTAIDEVTDSDDESFAVLELLLADDGLRVLSSEAGAA